MNKRTCLHCDKEIEGRRGKKFCDALCKSAYHYEKEQESLPPFYRKVERQLKKNRNILKEFNKAGKSTVEEAVLKERGFNAKFFTHFWKSKEGAVYLFVYEFGFLSLKNDKKGKYLLIHWQDYMN